MLLGVGRIQSTACWRKSKDWDVGWWIAKHTGRDKTVSTKTFFLFRLIWPSFTVAIADYIDWCPYPNENVSCKLVTTLSTFLNKQCFTAENWKKLWKLARLCKASENELLKLQSTCKSLWRWGVAVCALPCICI